MVLFESSIKLLNTCGFLMSILQSQIGVTLETLNCLALLSNLILKYQILLVLFRIEALEQLQNLEHVFHVVLQLALSTYQRLYLVDHVRFG